MIVLREGKFEDFEFYYNIKSEKSSVYWGGFDTKPSYEKLQKYYRKLINGEINRKLYIMFADTNPAGYLQLAKNAENKYEISYGVSEKYRGNGYGSYIISYAKNIVANKNAYLIGYVREDNVASIKCFRKNGFRKSREYDERYFEKDREFKKMNLWLWSSKMNEEDCLS